MKIYSFIKQVDIPSLRAEISAALPGINFEIDVSGTLIKVSTDNKLMQQEEEKLRAVIIDHNHAIPIITSQITERVAWGIEVIRRFRVYTMGIPDDQGLELLGNMMDVKTTLELGMLAASAYLLSIKPLDQVLDAPFDNAGTTFRQRFIKMILEEGPPP